MSLFDPSLPKAFADLGDGTAHDPQLRLTAPDTSARWNGFPVELVATAFSTFVPVDPGAVDQISSSEFVNSSGGAESDDIWMPILWANDYLEADIDDYHLAFRLRFSYKGLRLTAGITNPFSGLLYTTGLLANTSVWTAFDSGTIDVGHANPQCSQLASSSAHNVDWYVLFSSDALAGCEIAGTRLEAWWVAGGEPASYVPREAFRIVWGSPFGADPGLTVVLETNACGQLTKTYDQVAALLNADPLVELVATINHNGTDVAKPDADVLAGAEGSAATKYAAGRFV